MILGGELYAKKISRIRKDNEAGLVEALIETKGDEFVLNFTESERKKNYFDYYILLESGLISFSISQEESYDDDLDAYDLRLEDNDGNQFVLCLDSVQVEKLHSVLNKVVKARALMADARKDVFRIV